MAQDNVERIRESVEAFNRGDLDAAFGLMHPDVEWQTLDVFPDAGTYRGPEGVREFFGTWRDAFRGLQVHLEECAALDDHQVIAALRVSGEGAESGAGVRSPAFFQLFEIRDGQLTRARMFQTKAEALEAARPQG
jgi:ketosteroid isomerase-like protein